MNELIGGFGWAPQSRCERQNQPFCFCASFLLRTRYNKKGSVIALDAQLLKQRFNKNIRAARGSINAIYVDDVSTEETVKEDPIEVDQNVIRSVCICLFCLLRANHRLAFLHYFLFIRMPFVSSFTCSLSPSPCFCFFCIS